MTDIEPDRARETSRRQSAVQTLLNAGFTWDGAEWIAPSAAGLPPQALLAGLLTFTAGVPSEEAAEAIGGKGGSVVEAERLAFEAWLRGHCWVLEAQWDGSGYRGRYESFDYICPKATQIRRMWAAWRDRAALAIIFSTKDKT